MSNFITTDILPKTYIPFQKSWYIEGTARYPFGYWEGPSFGSSSCSSVGCKAPIYIYVRKVVWSNTSRHSIHKVKFRTSSLSVLLDTIYEKEDNRDAIDFVLINQNYEVVSYRSLEEQLKEDGKTFRKIWELDEKHFQKLKEKDLRRAMVSSEETKLSGGFRVFPLGSNSENWALIFHVSEAKYFEGLYVRSIISIVMSCVVLFLFLVVVCVTTCTMCEMRFSEARKRKAIRTTCMISESVCKLDFDNKKIKKLMKKKKRKCTKLERYLKEIITNIKSYMQYLPAQLRMSSSNLLDDDEEEESEEKSSDYISSPAHSVSGSSYGSGSSSEISPNVSRPQSTRSSGRSSGSGSTTGSGRRFSSLKKGRKPKKLNRRLVHLELGLRKYSESSFVLLSLNNFSEYFSSYLSPHGVSSFFKKYYSLVSVMERNRGMVHPIISHEVLASWNLGRRVVKHKELAVKTAFGLYKEFEEKIGKSLGNLFGLLIPDSPMEVNLEEDDDEEYSEEEEEGKNRKKKKKRVKKGSSSPKKKIPRISIAVVTISGVYYGNMKFGEGNGRAMPICGDVIKTIAKLEDLNEKYGTNVLINEQLAESVSMYLPLEIVDIQGGVSETPNYYFEKKNRKFLYTIGSKSSSSSSSPTDNKEWMYVLEDKTNPYDKHNDAWKLYKRGETVRAKALLDDYCTEKERLKEPIGDHTKRLREYILSESSCSCGSSLNVSLSGFDVASIREKQKLEEQKKIGSEEKDLYIPSSAPEGKENETPTTISSDDGGKEKVGFEQQK